MPPVDDTSGTAPTAAAPSKLRHIGLDALRMLALALVLGRHLEPSRPTNPWPSRVVAANAEPWTIPIELLRRGGWVGVDLFFVISGFLVAGLLLSDYRAHGRLRIGRFYVRRAWKIVPPFLLLIGVTAAVRVAGLQTTDTPLNSGGRRAANQNAEPGNTVPFDSAQLAAELTLRQNYRPGLWPHTWSLAVEEHFYLLLPLLLAMVLPWFHRRPGTARPLVALAVAPLALAFALRQYTWARAGGDYFYTHHAPTHLRFDALVVGVAIAYFYHFHPVPFRRRLAPWRRLLVAAGLLLLVPAFAWSQEDRITYTLGLTLFVAAGGMLVTGMVLFDVSPSGWIARAASLGAYSYSIYLWHIPMQEWIVPWLRRLSGDSLNYAARSAIYVIGSLALGVILAKLIELPLLRVRDRLFPARGPIAVDRPTPAELERT